MATKKVTKGTLKSASGGAKIERKTVKPSSATPINVKGVAGGNSSSGSNPLKGGPNKKVEALSAEEKKKLFGTGPARVKISSHASQQTTATGANKYSSPGDAGL